MLIKSFVSTTSYNHKPPQPNCGTITNQMKRGGDIEITPHQLAEYLCLGHTVCPVYPNKDFGEKSSMWFIGFDFDKVEVDMEERLKQLKDAPTIAYHTFSHLLDGIRYRFIYVFSEPIYGKDFKSYQKRLIERNHFGEDVDHSSMNINRFLHGTIHPVSYSGIVYDRKLNPIQLECCDKITRESARPPKLNEASRIHTYTDEDIAILTNVGVSQEIADYYFSHTWDEFLHTFPPPRLQEESEYVQVEGECYSIAPQDYYSLPRQWRYYHEERNGNTYTVTKPYKWEDGENRGAKLYQAIITLRTLNQDASASDLFYSTVSEYRTFYYNINSDGVTRKYDKRGLALRFVDGMTADITLPRKPLKHPSLRINNDVPNKRNMVPQAVAKERHKKILNLYNPELDIKANLNHIRETLDIQLSKRTLKKILNSRQTTTHITKEDRIEVFKCMYDPDKTDEENLRAMQDNIDISRASYYRLKRLLKPK